MMGVAAFDERYAREGDPWGYRTSVYEQAKYAATLRACGDGPFATALELGASIGVFSAMLAPRCTQLMTVDFSAVAVTEARAGLSHLTNVEAHVAEIPWGLEAGPYELIVASEVLYYLAPAALEATLTWLQRGLAHDGRLVMVHWRPGGPERPFTAAEVHDRVASEPWLAPVTDARTEDYLLDVLERA